MRTITAIGDRSFPVAVGEPGATVTADEPSRTPQTVAERSIRGRVVDELGQPVPFADVRLAIDGAHSGRARQVAADEAGRFRLDNLRAGTEYTVIAEYEDDHGEYRSGRARVAAPGKGVTIVVASEPSGAVRTFGKASTRRAPPRDGNDDFEPVPVEVSNPEDIPPAQPPATSARSAAEEHAEHLVTGWRKGDAPASNRLTTAPAPPTFPVSPGPDHVELPEGAAPAPIRPPAAMPLPSRSSATPAVSDARSAQIDAALQAGPAASNVPPPEFPPVGPSEATAPPESRPQPAPRPRPAPEPPPMPPATDTDTLAHPPLHAGAETASKPFAAPEPEPDPVPVPGLPPQPVFPPQNETESNPPEPSGPAPEETAARPAKRLTWGELAAAAANRPTIASARSNVRHVALTEPARALGVGPRPASPVAPACAFDARQGILEDFVLPDTSGQPVRFRDLDADLVLLDFWGTWCQPCRNVIPHLAALQKLYGPRRLRVVGIAYEQVAPAEAARLVAATAERLGINYTVLLGGSDGRPCPVQNAFRVQAFPTLVLLDRQGRVLWRDQGANPATLTRLDRVLAARTGATASFALEPANQPHHR